ncbi:4'-phosphopantetheinyl transferase family protein [Clostridium tyrobutyricum]|uniref:4'-phosphopantetheinyl transferase family protein n=1 Tax=Clostridium tyrobutyricum TaxID=1519 RepID=UPI001C37F58E|nr:4'-phosphopantetheinyl transferase superfamily protein [Clostridium tyrobutyricum]MBV4429417.1 4'-phosphopantetheinyl transferase superfamily protein [Clostridium tyrobutyricum]MBV4444639.1 4'-phosphopantetheinyl transferase superfamily protein [Clostridium tyrobutyricum]
MQSERGFSIVIKKYGNCELDKIAKMTLEGNEIQLWLLHWEDLLSWITYYRKIMSSQEQEYVNRFVNYDDRMRSATGKILTRKLLAHYMNISQEKVEISKSKYGKPILENNHEFLLSFNVSHSGKIVLVAMARGRIVGIDVERQHSMPDYLSLAKNFFTDKEFEIISNANNEELFFDYWTAKEAYVKAIGTGLNKELNSFEIRGNKIIDSAEQSSKWIRRKVYMQEGYIANIVYQLTGGT